MIQRYKHTDLVGKRFGRLVVIQDTLKRNSSGCVIWKCICDCGNICEKSTSSLNSGTKSCGCLHIESARQQGLKSCIDLTGQRFGKLLVLEKSNNRCHTGVKWICQCNCGNIVEVASQSLKTGRTQSCGCIRYSIGQQNIAAILNKNNIPYKREYCVKELGNKRFDFALLDINNKVTRFIEYDGEQHYQETKMFYHNLSLKERQERDKEKNNWAKENNIPLVRIPYWERDNITLDMILGDQYRL